jgi:hypothetical protein
LHALQRLSQALLPILEAGCEVCIHWIPGHCNIAGNEAADLAAKQATNLSPAAAPVNSQAPVPYGTAVSIIKKAIKKRWQQLWEHSEHGRHLFAIKPILRKIKSLWQGPRHAASLRCRLRHGHNALRFHLYDIDVVEDPFCETCPDAYEDAEHFLLRCPKYAEARLALRRALNWTPQEMTLPRLLGTEGSSSSMVPTICRHVDTFVAATKRFARDGRVVHVIDDDDDDEMMDEASDEEDEKVMD